MTYTDDGTQCPYDWMPVAMANGIEWAYKRKGRADRFNNLYRRGTINRLLWIIGAISTLWHTPKWIINFELRLAS